MQTERSDSQRVKWAAEVAEEESSQTGFDPAASMSDDVDNGAEYGESGVSVGFDYRDESWSGASLAAQSDSEDCGSVLPAPGVEEHTCTKCK